MEKVQKMKIKSLLKRTLCDGWELICDYRLPEFCYPAETSERNNAYLFNPLYAVVLLASAAAIIAGLYGRFLLWLLPGNGAALIFALTMLIVCEMRTSFRGMALSISFLENLLYGKSFAESAMLRKNDLRNISGLPALLLAAAGTGCKFFALFMAAQSGNYGAVGTAWVIALAAEGFLAGEPAAENMPAFCGRVKNEYIVAEAGFCLLFTLIFMPLATLLAAGAAAVLVIAMMNMFIRTSGRITSNDMTMTGYWLELLTLLIFAVMIG